jgi:hypothetical protein
MSNESNDKPATESAPAEAKRTAARRRFLNLGAAGSGIVIVTLFHQRSAIAGAKKVFVSSALVCASLHGTVQMKNGVPQASKVLDSMSGQKTSAFQCSLTK